jgi:hypothetical protein
MANKQEKLSSCLPLYSWSGKFPPSSDINEFWFPYWVKIRRKEKYGQFAPMIGKKALLQLLDEAIKQGFFDTQFLYGLARSTRTKLEAPS